LSFTLCQERQKNYSSALKKLRGILQKTLQRSQDQKVENYGDILASFMHLLMTVHYSYIMKTCSKSENGDLLMIACKSSITLLRYSVMKGENGESITIIPSDKAFYNAGQLCRKVRCDRLAFVLLNHFNNIVDAMEDKDSSNLEFDHFVGTILPFDTNLSLQNYIDDNDDQEEIINWVLNACIENTHTIPPSLSVSSGQNDGDLNEVLFASDNNTQCIVTGYPISNISSIIKCEQYSANSGDWKHFVLEFRRCPWTNEETRMNV